jgi:hypothetical protein
MRSLVNVNPFSVTFTDFKVLGNRQMILESSLEMISSLSKAGKASIASGELPTLKSSFGVFGGNKLTAPPAIIEVQVHLSVRGIA